jgi:endonuclease/exonuclease/phosphatase (EEP) superfamily protein YafD
MMRLLATYPLAMAAVLIVLPVLAPRSGPLALLVILCVHLALAAIVLIPVAIARRDPVLRTGLLALSLAIVTRIGGEWFSLPPGFDRFADVFQTATWNLELGARGGSGAVDGIRALDVDVMALQELGPEHASAIAAAADLTGRFTDRLLYPESGVFGIGLLSRWPITRSEHETAPSTLEATLDVGGRPVTVITAHPLPGQISLAGPFPVGFDGSQRDAALRRVRSRVVAAIGRGETVVVLGDFNVAPTEPAFGELVDGLKDAHAEVGQGPGWTWRPSRLEWTGLGLLRIDLALSGPGAIPIAVEEHCGLPGDHCQLEAWYHLETAQLGDRTFRVVIPRREPIPALAVSVLDTTGLVTDVNPAGEPFGMDGVKAVPGRERRIEVQWTGGACETGANVVVSHQRDGLLITIDSVPVAGGMGGCILVGYSRSIHLDLVQAVDPGRITVVVDGQPVEENSVN